MKATVTLDSDVELLLKQAMQQSGQSFKSTLNEAVRRGLADVVVKKYEKPFVVKAKNLGLRPGIDYSKINQLADELEVEAYLELTRRLKEDHSENNQ